MRNKEEIQSILAQISASSANPIEFDEENIYAAYQNKALVRADLAIKILSIAGGILATITFFAFLFLLGISDSAYALLLIGGVLISGAIVLNQWQDSLMLGSVTVSTYFIGYIMMSIGLFELDIDENAISILFIFIALLTLFATQNFFIVFIALLIANGCGLVLLISNDNYTLLYPYVALLAIFLTFIVLAESKIIHINKAFSKLYPPLRTTTIFIFLGDLALLGKKYLFPMLETSFQIPLWMPSIVIIATIMYTLSRIIRLLNLQNQNSKIGIYALTSLFLIPTVFAPAISGAVLVMLLSFMVNHKTGLALSLLALLYYIGEYYYNLNLNLLYKSIILMGSGALLLIIYFFIYQQLSIYDNEKI